MQMFYEFKVFDHVEVLAAEIDLHSSCILFISRLGMETLPNG